MNQLFDQFPDSYSENSIRIIQTPSNLARSTFFYVQETGYFKLKESHRAFRKNLESYLVVLVLSGSGTLMYHEKLYHLQAGSCFFIDCMVPYYHQSSTEDPWELMWIHFNGATSESYYRCYSSMSEPAFLPHSFQEIREKVESLLDVNTHSDLSAEIASSRLIMDILSILLQEVTNSKEEQGAAHEKLLDIRQYLDEHYAEKFSLDTLSEHFYISKYHLSREFKNQFGITPNLYVISKRITMVKKLLRFSDFSLEEIAMKCGFYDTSYMNKQFKKSEGISASDFRKKWIN